MGSVPSRILLCSASADVEQWLSQAGHAVTRHAGAGREPVDVPNYDLVVVENHGTDGAVVPICQGVRARAVDTFVPILYITSDPDPLGREQALQGGADACLTRPLAAGELLAQVEACLRQKYTYARFTEKNADFHHVNYRLQQAYQQIDQELELARRIQQGLLPQTLPEMPEVQFAVHYRPCGRVGGDFYDVFRLDEDHIGFYVADVMGHGIPASLLTMFLKKAVRAKEIFGREYRLLPPDEVLQQLNRDMIDQALAENPFITMVYALFDARARTLSFSRAGHPHPLYVPPAGKPEFWEVHGTLLGVFDTSFMVQTHQLRPGDKVLIYTDGLESVTKEESATEALLACVARYRDLPIDAFVAQLARQLIEETSQPDDFTLLGLEVRK